LFVALFALKNMASVGTQVSHHQDFIHLMRLLRTSNFGSIQLPNIVSESLHLQSSSKHPQFDDGSTTGYTFVMSYLSADDLTVLERLVGMGADGAFIHLKTTANQVETAMDHSDNLMSSPALSLDGTRAGLGPNLMLLLRTSKVADTGTQNVGPAGYPGSYMSPLTTTARSWAASHMVKGVIPQPILGIAGVGDEVTDDDLLSSTPVAKSWAGRIEKYMSDMAVESPNEAILMSKVKRGNHQHAFDHLYLVGVPALACNIANETPAVDKKETNLLSVGYSQVNIRRHQESWKRAKAMVGPPAEHQRMVQKTLHYVAQFGGFFSSIGNFISKAANTVYDGVQSAAKFVGDHIDDVAPLVEQGIKLLG